MPVVAAAIAVGLVVGFSARRASAQDARFAIDRFEPSERGSDWFANESLDLRGRARLAAGAVAGYAHNAFVTRDPNGVVLSRPVQNLAVVHLGGGLVLFDRVRLALDLPVQLYAAGTAGSLGGRSILPPDGNQGIGDPRLSGDVRLFGRYGDAITGALGVAIWAPIGEQAQWASDGSFRTRPRLMVAGRISKFVYSAQIGAGLRARSESFGPSSGTVGTELTFAAAVGVRVTDAFQVGPEIFGASPFDDLSSDVTKPVEVLLGARGTIARELRIGAAAGAGITTGLGAPAFRSLLTFEWAPPPDEAPGVAPRPAPPTPQPRVVIDSDLDGVEDELDRCPRMPGIRTNDPDTNGCPPDTDGDGIDDVNDACPTIKGDKTLDPETNGCDLDRDKDSVANVDDACPEDAGAPSPDPRRNGCPPARVRNDEIRLLDQPKFKGTTAELLEKESQPVLDAVLELVRGRASSLNVEGHTDEDPAATPARKAESKRLSAARAAAIAKWLVDHGIESSRVTSEGFGGERPIDTNETEAGRASNRRIELRLR